MKMTLTCMKMKLHEEIIFIWKVLHFDSFWNRGTRELGNGLWHTRVKEWECSCLNLIIITSKLVVDNPLCDITQIYITKRCVSMWLHRGKAHDIKQTNSRAYPTGTTTPQWDSDRRITPKIKIIDPTLQSLEFCEAVTDSRLFSFYHFSEQFLKTGRKLLFTRWLPRCDVWAPCVTIFVL